MAQTTHRNVSIIDLLEIFAKEFKNDNGWYSIAQLADIIECNPASLHPSFSTLRRRNYIVDSRRVPELGCKLYRIKKGNMRAIVTAGKKSYAALVRTRTLLISRSEEE